jgi:dolichol kinase
MDWDFKKEVGRKTIHLLSIFFLIIYIVFASTFSHRIALFILGFLLIILIEFEYLRVEVGMKIPIISLLWKYRRVKECNKLGGEVYFLIASILCLALFDLRIAAAAILMLTFGDLAAALIGKRFGRIWIPKLKDRAVEGVLAELIVDLIIGFLIVRSLVNGSVWWLSSIIPSGQPIWPIIITMALTATVVETLVHKLDDNLLVPLFSGFNGQIVLLLLSIKII